MFHSQYNCCLSHRLSALVLSVSLSAFHVPVVSDLSSCNFSLSLQKIIEIGKIRAFLTPINVRSKDEGFLYIALKTCFRLNGVI